MGLDLGIIGGNAMAVALCRQWQQAGLSARLLDVAELSRDAPLPDCLAYTGLSPESATAWALPVAPVGWRDALAGLVEVADRQQRPLLMVSSAQVFEGCDASVRQEYDSAIPASDYARALVEAGAMVRDRLTRRLILRVGPVVATEGTPLGWLLRGFAADEDIPLPTEPQVFPTPAQDVARVALAALRQLDCGAPRWGTYHYQASDGGSWYQFAEQLLAVYRQYHASQSRLVPREPTQPVPGGGLHLNCRRLLNTFGIHQRPWRGSLPALLRELPPAPLSQAV